MPRNIVRYKTRRYARDQDQVFGDDMKSSGTLDALSNQEPDDEKPGMGQHYCIPCAKYFESDHARTTHLKAKVHRRRVRDLKQGVYTREEADAAAGHNVAKFQNLKASMVSKTQAPEIRTLLDKAKIVKAEGDLMDVDQDDEGLKSIRIKTKRVKSSRSKSVVPVAPAPTLVAVDVDSIVD